ncbi:MAG: TonB-dependent receptor [Saccharospirillaceae bacterium]|nr:TonB-dependent receptor [Saccharospirillaceae bacterium]
MLFCGLLLLPPVSGTVAAEGGGVFNLSDVVVSASRSERLLADTPVRTQILDQATIQRLHSRDLRDALRILPGVQLREIHGKSGEEVYLQGFNGDRVLILVDGLPVSASTGSTVDISQLAMLDIEHIEIVPGAASALYGSAAMGGVINVITRKSQHSERRVSGHASLDSGTYGSRQLDESRVSGEQHLNASITQRLELSELRLGIDQRYSSGYDLNPDSWSSDGFSGSKSNLSAMLARRLGDSQWRFNAERFEEDSETRRVGSSGGDGVKRELLQRNRLTLQGEWQSPVGQWQLQALHEQQDDQSDQLNNDTDVPAGNLWRDTQYQQQKAALQWQRSLESVLGYGAEIVAGMEGFRESMEQDKYEIKLTDEGVGDNDKVSQRPDGTYYISTNEVPYARRNSGDLFTQLIIPLGINGDISSGARWQHDSDFGNFISPTISARQLFQWQGLQFQWRQSVGIGYRVPNLKNRYFIFDHSVNGYKVLGNEHLTPEKSRSLQTSISLTDNEHFHAELALFNNRIQDLIEAQDSGESEDDGRVAIYRYTNFANALTRGYDLSLQWQLLPGLQQRLSFGYLDARDLDLDTPLINRARHHAKALWLWDISHRVQLTLSGEYQGEHISSISESDNGSHRLNVSPAYSRWDIKGGWRLNPRTSLYGGVNNLFDTVRDSADAYDRRPVFGRMPYAGLSYQF